jgi:hypothetical protein
MFVISNKKIGVCALTNVMGSNRIILLKEGLLLDKLNKGMGGLLSNHFRGSSLKIWILQDLLKVLN